MFIIDAIVKDLLDNNPYVQYKYIPDRENESFSRTIFDLNPSGQIKCPTRRDCAL